MHTSIKIISLLILLSSLLHAQLVDRSWKLFDDSETAVIEITVNQAALDFMYANPHSDSMHVATVHFKNAFIDTTIENVGLRIRGNTSRDAAKKSFKLSFNTFEPGRQFYGVDKMNLNGEHNDPSIIRSKLCWNLFNEIGKAASRAAHTAIYINGEYYGLYISVEHIDDEFLEDNFSDDSGNLWKCLFPADLQYLGDNPDAYKYFSGDRQPYELTTNEETNDYTQLARLINILNNTPADKFRDSLESIIVVKEILKYIAVNVMVGSWDDYWSLQNNYYLYYEPKEDIFHFIPYDYDNTFGIEWWSFDWANVNPYTFGKVNEGPRPLVENILAINEYKNLYTHFLEFYLDNVYNLTLLTDEISRLKNMVQTYAENDTFRTLDYGFTIDDFNLSYSLNNYSNQHVKYGLRQFINTRRLSLRNQLAYVNAQPIIYDLTWDHQTGGDVNVNASIFGNGNITEAAILFTPTGEQNAVEYQLTSNPATNTKLVEEADRWTGQIPSDVAENSGSFVIRVTGDNNIPSYYPRSGPITLNTVSNTNNELLINEFMADNVSTIADQDGDYDDWLELYNSSDETILLTGLYLTDKEDNLTKWQFTQDNLSIAPGEYLVVWCDEDEDQLGLHTNFKLSASGEYIALVAADGVSILDQITFGAQAEDVSFGRLPDASNTWSVMTPTPGSANIITSVDDGYIPTEFTLAAYPNPFNPVVNINYSLPKQANVTINIYNVLGQCVWTSQQGIKTAGTHTLKWDGTNNNGIKLSSGIYICNINAGNRNKFIKLMMLK